MNWSASIGASVASSCISSAQGLCSVNAVLSSTVGGNTFTAVASGLTGSPLTYTATGVVGPADAIQKLTFDGTSVNAGTGVTLQVKVIDHWLNPVSGKSISWSVTSGGGLVVQPTTTTAADGTASVGAVLGPTPAVNSFAATLSGVSGSPVTFTFLGTVGPAARIVINSVNGANVPLGASVPLSVTVTDVFGNAEQGGTVSWTAPNGGGSSVTPATSTTDATGTATATGTAKSTAGGTSSDFVATYGSLSATISVIQTDFQITPQAATIQAGQALVTYQVTSNPPMALGATVWVAPALGGLSTLGGASTNYTPPPTVASTTGASISATMGAFSASTTMTLIPYDTFANFHVNAESPTSLVGSGLNAFDNNTGLTWPGSQQTSGLGVGTWTAAVAACAGYGRLPTAIELLSIVDSTKSNPAIALGATCLGPPCFVSTVNGPYWTSTPYAGDATQAWVVNFGNGASAHQSKTVQAQWRCVK